MLTQVVIASENAFMLPILGVTPKESILVRHIAGLDSPDIDLFMGDYARDGGIYQGRRVGKRNPVFTFELNPNPALGETVSGLREFLYKSFFDPLIDADYVKVDLHDDEGRVRYLVGYAEKMETEIFGSETLAQISMVCPDPYIRDTTKIVNQDESGWTTNSFNYAGSAETGFEAQIVMTGASPTLTLENNGRTMVMNRTFGTGEVIYINTIRGHRAIYKAPSGAFTSLVNEMPITERWAYLRQNGDASSIVASLTPASRWLEFHSQSNLTKVYGETTSDSVASLRELSYTQAYWGV